MHQHPDIIAHVYAKEDYEVTSTLKLQLRLAGEV
jgi:hypothetical protein